MAAKINWTPALEIHLLLTIIDDANLKISNVRIAERMTLASSSQASSQTAADDNDNQQAVVFTTRSVENRIAKLKKEYGSLIGASSVQDGKMSPEKGEKGKGKKKGGKRGAPGGEEDEEKEQGPVLKKKKAAPKSEKKAGKGKKGKVVKEEVVDEEDELEELGEDEEV